MKPQISCFCTSKKTNTNSPVTRGSKCKCFSKGKRIKKISVVDIHKVKDLSRFRNV